MSTTISLGSRPYREINAKIRELIAEGEHDFVLEDVFGQRYLAGGLPAGNRLEIHGTPGNDMSSYMDGAEVEVFGNGQDQIGNTMNGGLVVIHGHCGDAAGYAMRGGEIFVRDYVGWRIGIHMKEYREQRPSIVIGGDAGAFLGEYMAGGVVVLLGRPGRYLGSGMHGGVMYIRDGIDEDEVSPGLVQEACSAEDLETIRGYLDRYNAFFDMNVSVDDELFTKVRPKSSRPYATMYVKD